LHWKLAGSLEVRPKFADVAVVRDPAVGPPVIDVVGGVVSTVQEREPCCPDCRIGPLRGHGTCTGRSS
jgi:hypothetical protein